MSVRTARVSIPDCSPQGFSRVQMIFQKPSKRHVQYAYRLFTGNARESFQELRKRLSAFQVIVPVLDRHARARKAGCSANAFRVNPDKARTLVGGRNQLLVTRLAPWSRVHWRNLCLWHSDTSFTGRLRSRSVSNNIIPTKRRDTGFETSRGIVPTSACSQSFGSAAILDTLNATIATFARTISSRVHTVRNISV
jgi:hypothetical protein